MPTDFLDNQRPRSLYDRKRDKFSQYCESFVQINQITDPFPYLERIEHDFIWFLIIFQYELTLRILKERSLYE